MDINSTYFSDVAIAQCEGSMNRCKILFQSKPIRATPTTTTSGSRRSSQISKKDTEDDDSDEDDVKPKMRSRQAASRNGKEVCIHK